MPRFGKDGSIFWDDLDEPIYDVVKVVPLSSYTHETGFSGAKITILKDYLEDYLSHKDCSAIATYFDERFSTDDPDVAVWIGTHGSHFQQPGRELWFMKMDFEATQISQVWATAHVYTPSGSPVSDPPEIELFWPDHKGPLKGDGPNLIFETLEEAYIRDEVLIEYEKRNEFEIFPEKGFVSYDSRWAVSYCRRYSRNFIVLELRKLYEGAPMHVIKHYHEFSAAHEVAQKDRGTYGTVHIGIRAKALIYAFLQLTEVLSELSDAAGLVYSQQDIGQFKTTEIDYQGWWTFNNFKILGNVIPLTLSFPEFLYRSKEIFKIFENLRSGPLRNTIVKLGIQKEYIKDLEGLKLLGTISQLAVIGVGDGLNLISDHRQISDKWNSKTILPDLQPLFALFGLRVMDAHNSSAIPKDISKYLEVFGMDKAQCHSGWGLALDRLYDIVTSSLSNIHKLVEAAMKQ